MSRVTLESLDGDVDMEPHELWQHALIEHGVLVPTGVDGVYGKSRAFEVIVGGLVHLVSLWGDHLGAERLSFPPVINREAFEKTNYVESFPDLMGSVHVFSGDDADHAELLRRLTGADDWTAMLAPAEVTLAAAACHPVYPLCTGRLPQGGRRFEVLGYCFRHEPSTDPARMQSFRMQEVVYVGSEADAVAHRAAGLEFGLGMLRGLGLEMDPVAASDPFFGRSGRILAAGQLERALKIEGVTPIYSREHPTAIMSGNYHEDHFSLAFGIEQADGGTAHSACVAFGVERIALALLHRHGLTLRSWPTGVRRTLSL